MKLASSPSRACASSYFIDSDLMLQPLLRLERLTTRSGA